MGAFIQFGCSSEMPEMLGKDLQIAEKYNAEWVGSSSEYSARLENGELVQKGPTRFIVEIQNSDDIEKVIEEEDYGKRKGQDVADFVHDSVVFENEVGLPEIMKIRFKKYREFLGADITRSRDYVFELDSLRYQMVE